MGRRLLAALAVVAIACSGAEAPEARPEFVVALPWELGTLDPHALDKITSQGVLTNVFEGLVRLGPGLELQPALATSWQSPEPTRWVFHLRRGVRFHDGRPLTARDVVASYRRVLGRTDLEMRNYLVDVASVEAPDETTVELRTLHPAKGLLNKLSLVVITAGGDDAALRSGTGPYRIEAWDAPRSLRLARFDGYWDRKPALPAVRFEFGRSLDETVKGLRAGTVQLAQSDSRRLAAALETSKAHVIARRDNLFVKYLAYDLRRPSPFHDVRVRRAVNVAIDRHRLVSEMWTYAVPATQPVPRFVFGFNPAIAEAVADKDRARALLQEAGHASGFGVVLHARRLLAEPARVVAGELAGIGIRVEVRELGDKEFFELVRAGGATLWINRFGCTTGDATELLIGLLHSRDERRHLGMMNHAGYADPAVDARVEAVVGLEDLNVRRDAVQALLAQTMEQLVVVPLYNDQDVYALDRRYAWEPRSDSQIRAAEIGIRR